MAMRALVEPECGRANPLMELTNRASSDAAIAGRLLPYMPSTSSAGQLADVFTREYLNEMTARTAAPSSFSMKSLARQLPPQRPLDDGNRLVAAQWTREYQPSAGLRPVTATLDDWTAEYARSQQQTTFDSAWREAHGRSDDPRAVDQQLGSQNVMLWSREYLDKFDQSVVGSVAQAEATAKHWTDEYVSSLENENKQDYWQNLESEWDSLARNDPEHEWLSDIPTSGTYNEYDLQQNNPYMNVSDPLEEGKRLWAQGDLANAILHFEAAVHQDAQNSEAWRYLGSAQAENEQEPSAIAALRKSLDLNPSNLNALFALAVAYTNESMDNDALSALERWLASNAVYQGLVQSASINFRRPSTSSFLDRRDDGDRTVRQQRRYCCRDYFGELEQKFLEAAKRQPAGVDATLQNSLAVLYNLNGNFDRAVDCLRAALNTSPEDARLWNRLGATLANSDRPAEAVAAYSKALDLYPAYVRARYNLGISCMNLKSHREAVEHFVSALQLQQRGIGPQSRQQSDGIWQTLRSAVMRMERSDELLAAAESRDVHEFARVLHRLAPS